MSGGIISAHGQRKFATVVFIDIVDSSRLLATLDPEAVDDLVMPLLSVSCNVVLKLGGTVAQVLGDGILAFFGAPNGLEDHASRACFAALEVQRHAQSSPVPLRIGISSGEIVLARGVAQEWRGVGKPLHLAARAQQAAEEGTILATHHTVELLLPGIEARPGRPIALSRSGDPLVPAFTIVGASKSQTYESIRQVGMPFVGRKKEMKFLATLMDAAREGRGQTVLVHGEAGIGKTRFLSTFLSSVGEGARTARIGLAPRVLQPPFDTVVRLLKQCLGSPGKCTWTQIDQVPCFPKETAIDPMSRLKGIANWASDAIVAAARSKPLFVLIEDVDRLDSAAALVLRNLANRIHREPVLLALSVRTNKKYPDVLCDQKLPLEALSETEACSLALKVLRTEGAVTSLRNVSALCARAQGNPYFLEECAKATKVLSGAVGETSLVFATKLHTPSTIHTLLSERIDGLPENARSVLLVMSVVGETAELQLIREVCGQSSEVLLSSITTLLSAGLIFQLRILPEIEYSFHHSLLRDVAYGTLLRKSRRVLHRAVFDALKRKLGRSAGARLAFHASKAGRYGEAYLYALRATREARKYSRNEEARELLTIALLSLKRLGGTAKMERRKVDSWLSLASVLFAMGRTYDARRYLTKALRTARRIADSRRSVGALSDVSATQWVDGELHRAYVSGALAQKMAKRTNLLEPWIRASVRQGMVLAKRGDFRAAIQQLEAAIERVPPGAEQESFGLLGSATSGALAALSVAHGELGEFGLAVRYCDEALEIATKSSHPFSLIYAQTYCGNMFLVKGDWNQAIELLEEAVGLCETTGSDMLYPLAAAMLANGHAQLGSHAEAVKRIYEKAFGPETLALRSKRGVGAHWIAEAFLLVDEIRLASTLADQSIKVCRRASELAEMAWSMHTRGRIELHQRSVSAANQTLLEASRLAKHCEMRPLMRLCSSDVTKAKMPEMIK